MDQFGSPDVCSQFVQCTNCTAHAWNFCIFFWGTLPNYLNVGDVVDDGSDEDCNCIIGNDDDDDVDHDDHDDDDVDDDDDDVDEDDDDD